MGGGGVEAPNDKSIQFPDPGIIPIAQGEAALFTVLCQINSHVALPGAPSVVPPQYSMRNITSPRTSMSYNKSTNAMDRLTSVSYSWVVIIASFAQPRTNPPVSHF